MKELVHNFIHSKSELALLARTIFEAGVGLLSTHALEFVGQFNFDSQTSALMVAFVTVITTALLNWYRKCTTEVENV